MDKVGIIVLSTYEPVSLNLKIFCYSSMQSFVSFLLPMKCGFHFTCFLAAIMCPLVRYTAHMGGFLFSVQISYLIIPGTKISPQLTGTRLYTPISYGLMAMSWYLITMYRIFSFPVKLFIFQHFVPSEIPSDF